MLGDMGSFLLSFAFNFLVAFLVVRFIYYPSTHNKRYIFTFLAFNTLIYFVLSFMNSIEIGIGVGFGLFAIFSILRYRTDPIPIREMTYLFIIAALPVMNSAGSNSEVWWQLVAANGIILVILWVLEKEWGFHYEATKRITYERIELIHPDRRAELLEDLETRTGLQIKRISIGKVDFLRDTASIVIYYDDPTQEHWLYNPDPEVIVVGKDDGD
ncbi:MAG TPA: DUF4956 domain-containing protein [Anaerolineaceae bacterium]|nr:DUF4956 domain-containing protein [Longilinea sp.]HNS62993.1 DUF4956 domain-containing protein [Anaerolineaceae bacterium]HNZ00913.1 DUF4956 domain-containing protein [Anaerolineaceae bacterium]HOH20114.1 DUF4956 domain-containing protein [Anaerolineaceae bacterium]HOU43599.1 DUF4956 domain-containing protein [Anaerolineaceae bacterium]